METVSPSTDSSGFFMVSPGDLVAGPALRPPTNGFDLAGHDRLSWPD